jgi:nucleoside-diphosphate-sugar epimerase
METVLVTRAAGFFIGTHGALQLLARGHNVFGVVNPNVPLGDSRTDASTSQYVFGWFRR